MFLAHYAANNEYEEFDTFAEAKKWLCEQWDKDSGDEGFAAETIDGQDFIAVITHQSKFLEKGNKEKDGYKWNEEHQKFFIDGDPEQEEWPISDSFDFFGEVILESVNHTSSKKEVLTADE